ncbi:MAG: type II toxin-antitoxin system VapC family toxin [Hyphomonadaceae bacterium]|nr:type II toxin-antitoxin system VapC family toxin [Hyphomonadaceae bacterium]
MEVSVYLDASVLVSLFIADANSKSALGKVRRVTEPLVVSDFGAAEFASAVSRRVRMRLTAADVAHAALASFDAWMSANAEAVELAPSDVAATARMLRRLELNLRTPDAVHLAIVRRIGAALLTLDKDMKAFARSAGVQVI